MSNEEPQNQNKTTEEAALEKRRRFIKGAGIAAPVVLSLANRTAFGAQPCLSQQISGNISNGPGSCVLGYAPCSWKGPTTGSSIPKIFLASSASPTKTNINKIVFADWGTTTNGKIHIIQTKVVTTETYKWFGTNYIFGILTRTDTSTTIKTRSGGSGCGGSDGSNVTQEVTVKTIRACGSDEGSVIVNDKFQTGRKLEYTGAVPVNQVTSTNPTATLTLIAAVWTDFTGGTPYNNPIAFGTGVGTSMRQILNINSAEAPCVAALLNASTISSYAGGTYAEVKAMCNGTDPHPPGYPDLAAFFATTFLPC